MVERALCARIHPIGCEEMGLTMNILIIAGLALLGVGIFQESTKNKTESTVTPPQKKEVSPLDNINADKKD